jgi:hypothetical protein
MLKSLYEGYFQKSNVFLFPILGISKGSSVTPVGIYTSLKGHYTHSDYKLITTYYLRDDPEFNVFEKTRLLGNKYFHDYLETSKDVGVYIFDLSDYKKDWDYFLQGKYSKLSKDLKLIILSHYAKSKKNYVYVDSYLNPEMYFDIYSKLLECSPKLLKDVGELCDKPSLRKETLEITLKNLEKDGLSLNSH